MNDNKPDTLTGLALEYLEGKRQGKSTDVATFLARLPSDADRVEFTQLLELYDEIDAKLTRKELVAPQTMIGDLRIIRWLGQGGMGVVYLAEQTELKRQVAVKLLPIPLLLNQHALERFRREVMTLAALRHPGIVPVHTVGSYQGMPYFTMDYIEGPTLQEAFESLGNRRPDQLDGAALRRVFANCDPGAFAGDYVDVIVRIIAEVADALHHAHENGVLHRDVKPLNILLTRSGRPLLFDFGLARETGAAALTRTGELAGSPYYVAPEQLRGTRHVIDRRVDVYALGVTLFQALTLELPFTGDSADDVLRAILLCEPPAMRKKNPTVHADLETICLKAMDRDPKRRFATAKDFADDLRNFLAHRPITARPLDPSTRAARWARRHPLLAAGALASVLMLVARFGYQLYQQTSQIALANSCRERGDLEQERDTLQELAARYGSRSVEQRLERVRRDISDRYVAVARAKLGEWIARQPKLNELRARVSEDRSTLLITYRPEDQRAQVRSRALALEQDQRAAENLLQEVRSNLTLAAKEDGTNASVYIVQLEMDRQDALMRGDTLRLKSVERDLERETGRSATGPAPATAVKLTGEPAGASVSVFRYLRQSDFKIGGEPRLVPVPGTNATAPWCLPGVPFFPGDACVAITSVDGDGVGAELGLRPGTLVLSVGERRLDGGLYVIEVSARGASAAIGLGSFDRITRIGKHPVTDRYDVSQAMMARLAARRFDAEPGKAVMLGWSTTAIDGSEAEHEGVLPAGWPSPDDIVLGDPEGLLAKATAPRDLTCRVLQDGVLQEVVWPADTQLGIRCEATACPLVLGAASLAGTLPVTLSLESGSYLIVARHPDCDDLRLPLAIESGSPQAHHLRLPAAHTAPEGFVAIAAGPAALGGDANAFFDSSAQSRTVEVASFAIARHEVTVEEYFAFLNEREQLADARRSVQAGAPRLVPRELGLVFREIPASALSPASHEPLVPYEIGHPIGGVSQNDAVAYCAWRTRQHRNDGGTGTFRLPTAAEWEKAARGTDRRFWSFGNDIDPSFCHLFASRAEPGITAPVGSTLRDESPFGVRDLTGNVMEWTATLDPDPPAANAPVIFQIKGASYGETELSRTRAAAVQKAPDSITLPRLGFRLVWEPGDSN